MKRFLLFGSDNYYPSGGWNDFILDSDTVEEIHSMITIKKSKTLNSLFSLDNVDFKNFSFEWYQIMDCESMEIVEQK